jgi:hypothetical protein
VDRQSRSVARCLGRSNPLGPSRRATRAPRARAGYQCGPPHDR